MAKISWLILLREIAIFFLKIIKQILINTECGQDSKIINVNTGLLMWCSWLRHYAANRQDAGSIPDGVIGIFWRHNPSGRTVALRSTQLLKEMITRFISWGKGDRCVRLTTLPPSCAVVMKSGNLNFLEPSGPLQACNGTAVPVPVETLLIKTGKN